jgi:hypothetical protein
VAYGIEKATDVAALLAMTVPPKRWMAVAPVAPVVTVAGQDHRDGARPDGQGQAGQQQIGRWSVRRMVARFDQRHGAFVSDQGVVTGRRDEGPTGGQPVAVPGCRHRQHRSLPEDARQLVGRMRQLVGRMRQLVGRMRVVMLQNDHRCGKVAGELSEDAADRVEPSGGAHESDHRGTGWVPTPAFPLRFVHGFPSIGSRQRTEGDTQYPPRADQSMAAGSAAVSRELWS